VQPPQKINWSTEKLLLLKQQLIKRFHGITIAKCDPPSILFKDLSSWGCWDDLSQTIFLSKALIERHSYYTIEGVFLHEVAHFLVDQFEKTHTTKPHGELFQKMCARIGVPNEFRKAAVDLHMVSLDIHEVSEEDPLHKFQLKVEKLLSLAQSSNEHESSAAMNKVRHLYALYHVAHDSSNSKDPFGQFVSLPLYKKNNVFSNIDAWICTILQKFFYVDIFFDRKLNFETQKNVVVIQINGTRANVLIAEYVYYFLLEKVIFLLQEELHKKTMDRVERRSFQLGILSGFYKKLEQLQKNDLESTNSQTALMVSYQALMQQKDILKAYVREICPGLHTHHVGSRLIDHNSWKQGLHAGSQLNLSKPLEYKQGQKGRLLTF
jgi:hypothetical protein